MRLSGIDVSKYQGQIDWAKVAGEGIAFAFIRASDGKNADNETMFAANWAGANGAGLITGAYHILRPSEDLDSVRAQARLFLGRVGEAMPAEQAHYLPAVLDVEVSAAINADAYAAAIRTWIAAVEADARFAGRPSIIYTRASFWREIGEPVEFASRPLWVADYSRDPPRLPAGWAGWRFFQWTSTSKVAGIEGDVDGNYFDGTLDALRELAGPPRITAVPYKLKGNEPVRYYQYNAVDCALERIAAGGDRILLTLATGTGKTRIAFQLAWKLFESSWNLSHKPNRRPRILFLVDRNILADQAYNEFSDFPDDALARIKPDEIRKKGRVPKNASIFFTIFQTFMSGRDAEGEPAPYFGEYPRDFFDFIIIDECHRGGAKDESDWRAILEYFKPAVQLGLTATPKRNENVDTYAYFGEPVYTYSLKEGINDGFLTPFKVRAVATTLDEYVYTPDDAVVEGAAEEWRRYREADFNPIIEIGERERYRVKTFMEMIDQREKTLVFCATQDHALAVRDLINQIKTVATDPNYCVRVIADEGARGEQELSGSRAINRKSSRATTRSCKRFWISCWLNT